jgi:hypothetical protein
VSGVVLRLPDDVDARDTLTLIARARQNLAEARTLPDIRHIIEVASVATDAAKRAAKLAEAQQAAVEIVEAANDAANDAASVRIEAQAKAGELLREMLKSGKRARRGGDHTSAMSQPATKLESLGVSRTESSRWQRVASVPPAVRHEYVDEARNARQEVSTAGLLRHAHNLGDVQPQPALRTTQSSIDHAAIAAETTKRVRAVYRGVIALPGYRPEALVSALDRSEKRSLLRALGQLSAWIEDVRKELAIHRVVEED